SKAPQANEGTDARREYVGFKVTLYASGQKVFSVAPMLDWTEPTCRYFHRQLSCKALLYTEMLVADAVIHGDRTRLLELDPSEHPVAAQLGGSDPQKVAEAARIVAD